MKNNNQNITDDLLMAYLLGELADEHINEIEVWLSLSEENSNYLDELEKVWLESGNLIPKPVVVDIDKAWSRVEAKIFQDKKIIPLKKTRNLLWFSYRIAAVFIISFGIFGLYKIFNSKPEIQTLASLENTLIDTLSDGSIISLNKNSKLSFPDEFEGEQRIVNLEGEAFFEIAHNEEQPFIIDANGGFIQVVGTQFNVKADSNEKLIQVYVEGGIVKLYNILPNSSDTISVLLTKGEKGIIDKNTGKPEKLQKSEESSNDLFWKYKVLNFNSTKLDDAVKTLEKIFDVKFEISENAKNLPLTATFEGDSLNQILEVIKLTFNLKISENNKIYRIDVVEN
jgi:ferric-dicitrate binding protein FerR (iron transport regulator)